MRVGVTKKRFVKMNYRVRNRNATTQRRCRRRRCSRRQHAAAGRDDQAAAQDQRAPSGPDLDCLSFTGSGTHPHSTRAAVAASRTLRWQPSEERDPADHRAQPGKVKYAETGFSDTVPTRLTKCGRLDSNWHWNPCSYPSSPESLPRLDLSTTRRPCRGRLSFGEESSRSFKVERLGGAHAHRTQLQQLKYVTMRTHRLLCVSSSAERALAQPPKYIGRKYDLYHHHSHPSQKCKYHNP